MTDPTPTLRMFAEHDCYPLWVTLPGGGEDNPDPHDLGLPDDLADDLVGWADDFDAIFPEDDPGSAAFPDPAAEAAFYDGGLDLARRVARAVEGRFTVTYRDHRRPAAVNVTG